MKKEVIINYIKKFNIEEYKLIKENADFLLEDKVRFVNNWAMERCEDIVDFSDFNWNKIYNNDPEWAFMVNRQEYLIDLFVTYVLENDIKYLDKIKRHIFEKIKSLNQNEMNNKKLYSRTLDTGIRISQWIFLLKNNYQYELFTDFEVSLIKDSIVKQIEFLYESFEERYYLSNWGSIQIVAVLQFNSLYKGILNEKVISFFENALVKNVNISIYEDGTQWEQSIMYHNDVMMYLLFLLIFDEKYSNILRDKVYKMGQYLYHAIGPDNIQFAIGDSDFTDTRDIMTWLSIYFKDKKFKSKAFKHPDIISYFRFSEEDILYFEMMSPNLEKNFNKFYKDSGHIFLKDENFHVFFKNGVMGRSHTHSDLNSINFYYKGKPIVIDSGRYTYVDGNYRNLLKSMEAHSSLIVDDECPEIVKGSWDYNRYPESLSLELIQNEFIQYIESVVYGEISNYNYIHTRYLIKFKDKCLFVIDKVKMKGKHKANIRFILDENINEIKNYGLKILGEEKYFCKETKISKKYNTLGNSQMLVREEEFEDSLYISTVFYDESIDIEKISISQTNKGEELMGSFAWKIRDEKEYILNLNTEQIITGSKILKIYENDILTRGKCVIINNTDSKYCRIKS